jgi:hypothetical protein
MNTGIAESPVSAGLGPGVLARYLQVIVLFLTFVALIHKTAHFHSYRSYWFQEEREHTFTEKNLKNR